MFVLVRPRDEQRVPFELRVDLFTQARYTNFRRSADSWIDSTGARQPISNFASGEVMRNFIQFSGFGIDPRLQFSAFIFSSTALNDTVYLGWINYRFSDALDIRVGNWARARHAGVERLIPLHARRGSPHGDDVLPSQHQPRHLGAR